MKHAILITAYKDLKQLADLVDEFDATYFNVYIHIDKKSKVDKNIVETILNKLNVKCIERKYIINWGGINHLNAYLLLSEIALKDQENVYFHAITAQDYPIKSVEYFNQLLKIPIGEQNGYMEYFKMGEKKWKNGGMDRLEYYYLNTYFNMQTPFGLNVHNYLLKLQMKLNFKRSINLTEQLYGGSTYWTLPRVILLFVINYTKDNPTIYDRLKYSVCGEEIYFQTVLMNSPYAKNMINDNLRFMDWEKDDYGPAFLTVEDYDRIVKSNKLFARKIASQEHTLMNMLKLYKDQEV